MTKAGRGRQSSLNQRNTKSNVHQQPMKVTTAGQVTPVRVERRQFDSTAKASVHATPQYKQRDSSLQTATTATTLPPGRVGRGRCDVLDTANTHTGTGESAEGRLGTGAGGLGAVTTSSPDLDVEGSDAELLAAGSCSMSVFCSYLLSIFYTYRRPEPPTWQRRERTRHGQP